MKRNTKNNIINVIAAILMVLGVASFLLPDYFMNFNAQASEATPEHTPMVYLTVNQKSMNAENGETRTMAATETWFYPSVRLYTAGYKFDEMIIEKVVPDAAFPGHSTLERVKPEKVQGNYELKLPVEQWETAQVTLLFSHPSGDISFSFELAPEATSDESGL